jgi:aquaglyceroporin related protein
MTTIQQATDPTWTNSTPRHNHPPNKEHIGNLEDIEKSTTNQSTAISQQTHPIRSHLGLKEKPPIDSSHDTHPHQELLWSRIRMTLREPFAEFWGTAVMVFFGNGSVAQVLLSQGTAVVAAAPGGNGYGAYQSISWG